MRSYQNVFTQVNHTVLITGVNIATKYRVRRKHTVRSTHGCRLSTRIFAVSYDRPTKSSDEMSTKTSRILILILVDEKNTAHNDYSKRTVITGNMLC